MTEPTEWEKVIDKYFYCHLPWGSVVRYPQKIGSLADNNWDPTFGADGLTLAKDIYECLVCGAAVSLWERHIEWHEGQIPPH